MKEKIIPIGISIFSIYLIYLLINYSFYVRVIPGKIQVNESIEINSDFEECGGGVAIFKLSNDTISNIKREGITFFANARQGKSGDPYHSYGKWEETPVPPSWRSEGLWQGLGCATSLLVSNVVDASSKKGAYYTVGHCGVLMVIPHLGIIVFTYFD